MYMFHSESEGRRKGRKKSQQVFGYHDMPICGKVPFVLFLCVLSLPMQWIEFMRICMLFLLMSVYIDMIRHDDMK